MSSPIIVSSCLVVLLLLILAPLLAFAIVALVLGKVHSDTTCDLDAVISLSGWLVVYGATGIAFVGAFVMLAGTFYITNGISLILLFGFLFLYNLFSIAWNIIGAVALFRDGMDCRDENSVLWNMTLAVLILQWIGFVLACFTTRSGDQ